MGDGASAKDWLAGVFDRAAPTYDRVGGGYHEHFGRRLVERAGVRPGDRVLDVACGHGAVLLPAALAAGPTGEVRGGDLSPAMVQRAREALDEAGLPGEVAVMDAEALEVDPGSCDRVLCGFGLFFLPHPDDAVAGFHCALAPGGVVGVSTWGDEDPRWAWEDDLLADLHVEQRAVVQPFDREEQITELLRRAGFGEVAVATERHHVTLADADEWWAWKWSYSLRGVLEQVPPDRIESLRADAAPHLDRLRTEHGLPLELTALIATATR